MNLSALVHLNFSFLKKGFSRINKHKKLSKKLFLEIYKPRSLKGVHMLEVYNKKHDVYTFQYYSYSNLLFQSRD